MENETSGQKNSGKTARPPIVVVMGHVDHGKTKILDWYRKSKVAEQESGGITQHIGAYEVEHHGKKITFIDTPGHEAFSKLRSRGAVIADIAILVIAAEEGIKPQTKEAIEIIKNNSLPFVVALNKIDKAEANPERIKQQLAEEGIMVEGYGGQIPVALISAKTGAHMDELLEVLLLVADLENLTADKGKSAEGVVIEAHRDQRRGNTATLLVRDGTLRKTDILVSGRTLENIKILEDFLGRTIQEAGPSTPVLVAGITDLPDAGDLFRSFPEKKEAEEYLKTLPEKEKIERSMTIEEEGKTIFNIILKTDVFGSKEALEEQLKKIETEQVKINIVKSEVGDIGESDIKFALATNRVTVVGFKVKADLSAQKLAEDANIHIVTGDIIYDLLREVKNKIEERLPPEIVRTDFGKVKILKIFKKEGAKQIIGGRVEEGIIKKGAPAEIVRMREVVGHGTITQLQREKIPADEIAKGNECGMLVESKTTIQEGDLLHAFGEEIKKQKL